MTRRSAHAFVRLCLFLAVLCAALVSLPARSQNPVNGKLAYTTPQVVGQLSCSAAACHTINPINNQNKILKGVDDPGAIGVAVNTVSQMAFLKNRLTTTQFIDLAAYIGNPAAANGTPTIALSSSTLSFADTQVGTSANAQVLTVSNAGTAALTIGSIVSNLPDFAVNGNCASVAAGATCNLSVRFAPTQTGLRAGSITLTHDAAGGSSSVGVSGTGSAPLLPQTSVPLTVNFGAVVSDQWSEPVVVNVTSVGSTPLVVSGISVNTNRFQIARTSCVTGAPIAVNSDCTITMRFTPSSVGAQTGSLSIQHNASAVATVVSLAGTGVAPPPPPTKTMTEFWYVPLNYYFITSRDEEKQQLDQNVNFRRTGARFTVLADQSFGAQALVRFYFDKVAIQGGRGSHFYTLLDNEKLALAGLNPNNLALPRLPFNEGVDSWAYSPVVAGEGGRCEADLVPVYRLFRGSAKFPDDPNHRYVLNPAVYREFVALGWEGEGVQMCLPPQQRNAHQCA
jgi:hypothetical protein